MCTADIFCSHYKSANLSMLNDGSFVDSSGQSKLHSWKRKHFSDGLDGRKRRAVSLTWSNPIANDRPWQAIDEANSILQHRVTRRQALCVLLMACATRNCMLRFQASISCCSSRQVHIAVLTEGARIRGCTM